MCPHYSMQITQNTLQQAPCLDHKTRTTAGSGLSYFVQLIAVKKPTSTGLQTKTISISFKNLMQTSFT